MVTWQIKYPISLACTFLWIGFVGAISFGEAWIKFRAPGITLTLGLGIGRLVFFALNKVEICLAFLIVMNYIITKKWSTLFNDFNILIPLLILITQTFWMLPILDTRAALILEGKILPTSNLHLFYIISEVIKVLCLIIYGISLFENTKEKCSYSIQ